MRALVLALLLLAPAGFARAADGATLATLELIVEDDRSESMTLSFDGLHRLTRYHGLCLPAGARESRVFDGLGDVPYEATDEEGRRIISFVARGGRVTVEMARAAPAPTEHPLYSGDVNYCVPAHSESVVRITLPARHTLFFLSDGGRIEGQSGTLTRPGAVHAFYTYEAPLAAAAENMTVFDAAPFRVFVASAHEAQAREVVGLARGPFLAAAAEAGLTLPFDRLRVLYAPSAPESWEAGHYDGKGFVTIAEASLADDPTAGYPYTPVKVVVHEGFHALSFPFGKGRVNETISWWLEGTARHAERHAHAAMPENASYCQTQGLEARCWDFDDRIRRADLETAYAPNFTFEPRWEPKLPQTDDARSFYYGLSGVIVGAWVERHGVAAYRAAWDEMIATFAQDDRCPCDDGWLIGTLARAAGTKDGELFTPWIALKVSNPPAFEEKVRAFVRDEAALDRELDAAAKAAIPALLPSPAVGLVVAFAVGSALARKRR